MARYWVELHCEYRVASAVAIMPPYCDSHVSEAPGDMTKAPAATARRLRKDALANGWKLVAGKMACPGCVKVLQPT